MKRINQELEKEIQKSEILVFAHASTGKRFSYLDCRKVFHLWRKASSTNKWWKPERFALCDKKISNDDSSMTNCPTTANFGEEQFVCERCLKKYRQQYINGMIALPDSRK